MSNPVDQVLISQWHLRIPPPQDASSKSSSTDGESEERRNKDARRKRDIDRALASHEMKIQCDVCEKEQATVFCLADEAALCDGCDRRVHRANKLAGKHTRYSLLQPTVKDSPLCDICRERRALLFCQEDRAMLCRDWDTAIHGANEHTQKHSRFLLIGVRLSAPHHHHHPQPQTAPATSASILHRGGFVNPTFEACPSGGGRDASPKEESIQMVVSGGGNIPANSISEYLMGTLPGWGVDEFLDNHHHIGHHLSNINSSIFSTSHGYSKAPDRVLLMLENEFGSDTSSGSSASRDLPISVPQYFTHHHRRHHHHQNDFPQNHTAFNNGGESEKGRSAWKSWRRRSDGGSHEAQFSQGILRFWL
ncbi:hypothetical protein SAY86_001110 [Trapa natans]|uniref:B box-type domain-containing protein n=1 Tax=Trapa natans TaxID=22666 RepID=A0AAN7RG68_TRANT|nr:hypothetical protein SAY86_001110 [Trapa natans]